MDGMNAEQIERVFGSLARIEQKIDGHSVTLSAHADHDQLVQKELFVRIEALQLSHAKQKGFFTALAAGVSALSAGAGYLIQKWLSH